MTTLEGRPRLKAGCRMSPAGDVLLIPEGALKLQGPARSILEACDGTRTLSEVVEQLLIIFPQAEAAKISAETATFLTQLAQKGVIKFV